jgi:hypothetical protein
VGSMVAGGGPESALPSGSLSVLAYLGKKEDLLLFRTYRLGCSS